MVRLGLRKDFRVTRRIFRNIFNELAIRFSVKICMSQGGNAISPPTIQEVMSMQIEDLQALCAYPPTNIKLKESYAHHTIKIFIFIWNKFKEWLINNNKESINENNINEYIKYISTIYNNEELSSTHFMKKVEALNALKRYCAFGVFRLSEKFDSISFYGEDEKYFKMFLEEYSKNHCSISINRIKNIYLFYLIN